MTETVTCIDVEGNEHTVSATRLSWRPSVYGIVVKDEHILLSKQFGRYDLPGGGLNLGERLEDGVIREVKEETGLQVMNPRMLGAESSLFQAAHSDNGSYHSILLYFACDYVGGTLSTDGFDDDEKGYAGLAEWIPLDTLDTISVASTVDYRPYVRRAAQGISGR